MIDILEMEQDFIPHEEPIEAVAYRIVQQLITVAEQQADLRGKGDNPRFVKIMTQRLISEFNKKMNDMIDDEFSKNKVKDVGSNEIR